MKVNSQLERAQLENLSSLPAAATVGRIAENTTDGKTYLDNGSAWVAFIKNDGKAIIGTNGTAANNVRFHRGANGLLQAVVGSDTTSEGTLSTSLAQLSAKHENYVAAGIPAVGNAGRVAYITDTGFLNLDTGAAWKVLVDASTAQTLTNKTLTSPIMAAPTISDFSVLTQITTPANPSAGTNKVYTKSDNKMYILDSSGNELAIGSGGGFNYLAVNPSAESGTFGWATYADAAGSSPVDGTGGSPNSTFTRSATAPLRGTGSFLFTHNSGTSRQGEGVSYDFTIDSADKAKVLQISFDYLLDSGTFVAGSNGVDSDLTVWIYDVTNGVVIQPTNYKLAYNSTSVAGTFSSTFQTSSNSTSYRLIVHCGTTSTAAFVMKFDNFTIAPQVLSTGTLITDWKDFPDTSAGVLITGSTSNPTYGTVTQNKAQYRRVGSDLEIKWDYVQSASGSEGVGNMLFNIPSSIGVIDTTKAPVYTGANAYQVLSNSLGGFWWTRSSGNLSLQGIVYAYSSSQLSAFYEVATAPAPWHSNSGLFGTGAGNITLTAKVPILGWGTNTDVLSGGEGRVVTASVTHTSNLSITGGSAIKPTSVLQDTHGAYNSSTGEFTCPVNGTYDVTVGGITSSGQRTFKAYKNGSYYMALASIPTSAVIAGTFPVPCNAGDKLTVVPDSSDTLLYSATNYQMYLAFSRKSGPEQIQAGEKVIASYYKDTANQSLSGSPAVVIFNTKDVDSHGTYNTSTGKWTAPRSGFVRVSGQVTTTPSGGYYDLFTYKNGSTLVNAVRTANNTSAATICTPIASKTYPVLAGETFEIQAAGGGWTIDATNLSFWNNVTFEML